MDKKVKKKVDRHFALIRSRKVDKMYTEVEKKVDKVEKKVDKQKSG